MLAALRTLADIAVEGLVLALIGAVLILGIAFFIVDRVPLHPIARALILVVAFLLSVVLIYNAVSV